MRSLQDILTTLKHYYPEAIIEETTKYRGKLILIDSNGSCYVPNIKGGIDHFGGMSATQIYIEARPDDYLTSKYAI